MILIDNQQLLVDMIIKSRKIEEKLGVKNMSCFSFQSVVKDCVRRSISGRKQVTSNLQLSKLPRLTPDDLKDILRNFPHVNHLDLSGCYQICKESIGVIASEYKDVLQSLNLEFCHYITDEDIVTLFGEVKEDGSRDNQLNMVSLNLSYTNISDIGLRTVTLNCPNLKVLKLRGMKNITDLSLSMIAKHCKSLTHIDVQECYNITDYGVSLISQECKLLEHVNVNGTNVTNNFIPYICFYNHLIKELDLRNTKVCGDALGKILANLLKLESLKISGLSFEKKYMYLLLNLKSIKELDISFCYDINLDLIRDLIRSCSALREIHLFGLVRKEDKQALLNINSELSIFC